MAKRITIKVNTTYDYFKAEPKYAILLQFNTGEFRWVTDICHNPKTFNWHAGKEAYLFDDYAFACDTAWAMCINGYYAQVVTVHNWHTSNRNPKNEESNEEVNE